MPAEIILEIGRTHKSMVHIALKDDFTSAFLKIQLTIINSTSKEIIYISRGGINYHLTTAFMRTYKISLSCMNKKVSLQF